MTISAVVICGNEEANLGDCLESVKWCDEIVVVDSMSADRTPEIARRYTQKVIQRPWPGYVAQKNFALEQATGDWILSIDADERCTPELQARITGIVRANGPADGYSLPRRNVFWGAWVRHGGLYPDRQLRLFRRGAGQFVDSAVH